MAVCKAAVKGSEFSYFMDKDNYFEALSEGYVKTYLFTHPKTVDSSGQRCVFPIMLFHIEGEWIANAPFFGDTIPLTGFLEEEFCFQITGTLAYNLMYFGYRVMKNLDEKDSRIENFVNYRLEPVYFEILKKEIVNFDCDSTWENFKQGKRNLINYIYNLVEDFVNLSGIHIDRLPFDNLWGVVDAVTWEFEKVSMTI